MEISSTPDVEDQPEQTASLDGVTGEPGNSCHKGAADAVIIEARAAAAAEQPAAVDGDEQATKRRLETLLQLETRARRTVEENFRRVKGFGFNFLFVDLHFSTHVGHGYIIIPPPIAVAECCVNVSVCCLSVREHISGTTRPIFSRFLCILPAAACLGPPLATLLYFRFYG